MTSTRALTRALGIGHLTPANIVKQATTSSNSLSYPDYISFWNSVQRTQSGATKMMVELLNKFVEVERQHAKRVRSNPKDAVKEQDRVDRILWMLVNTIRFVDLFLGVEANNGNLRKAHRAYETHRNEFPATNPSAREMDAFLKTVFRSVFELADTTNALVMELVFVNSVEWTLEGSAGARDLCFSVLRDCPFIGLRLMAKIGAGGKESYTVFFEMAKQLNSMPSLIRAQPALMNSTMGNVQALLFLIQECLCFFPVVDKDVLKKCLDAVKQFQTWPIPYGSYAASLAQVIEQEMRLPGTAMRRKLQRENPLLTDFGAHQADRFGSQGTDWASAHRIVTVLHNGSVSRSHLLRRLIGRSLYKGKAWANEMHACREDVLVSLFETVFVSDNTDTWHTACATALRNRHQVDLADWYERAMRCIKKVGEEEHIDTAQLMLLAKDISPSLADSSVRPRVARQQQQLENDGDDENEEDDILTDLETLKKDPFNPKLWTQAVPRTPHLSFEFLEIFNASQRRANTQEGGLLRGNGPPAGDEDEEFGLFNKGRNTGGQAAGGGNKARRAKTRTSLTIPGLDIFSMNPAFEGEIDPFGVKGQHNVPQKYVAYPSDFEELVKDARLMLPPDEMSNPSRASFTMMTGAAAHSQQSAQQRGNKSSKPSQQPVTVTPPGKPVLKRVILGGLDVVHRALCTYVALLAVDPQLASKVDFQFFLVPLGRNDLAAFIAQRDGWYRKHVFVPFHGPLLLVPQMKADGSLGADPSDHAYPSVNAGGVLAGNGSPRANTPPGGNMASSAASAVARRTSANATTLMAAGARTLFSGGGNNPAPPSNFDSDFGGDSNSPSGGLSNGVTFEGDEDNADDGGFGTLAGDVQQRRHKIDAVPGKLLRPLMESYVRGAKNQYPVIIYDCECWESPDAIEVERNPDITIPFCVRVEIGLGAAMAMHASSLEFTTNFEGHSVSEGLGADPSTEEMFNDKSFLKAISGNNPELKITTPELTVSMYTMGVDGTLDDRYVMELADSHYLSLVIASVPRFTFPSEHFRSLVGVDASDPPATAANPSFPWLEVQSVAAKPSMVELIKKRDKKPKDMDSIQEVLKYESKTHHIGLLDIRSTLASRMPFIIAVDGQPFGPFYRVRVRKSTALSASGGQAVLARTPQVTFPIMTFFPTDKGA